MKKSVTTAVFALFLGLFQLAGAQQLERQVIASGGTTGTGGGMTMDYTIGELVVATGASGSIILTQGFQQADYIITGITQGPGPKPAEITVFPNPATDEVNLRGTVPGAQQATLEMWDVAGKLISRRVLALNNGQLDEKVDLSGVAVGQYHFSLYDGEILKGSFAVRKVK